jgi:hypothetical protein
MTTNKNYPKSFSHIGLTVPNIKEAVKFYSEVMGWYVIMEPSKVKKEKENGFELAKRSTIKTVAGLAFLGVAWSSGSSLYRSYLNGRKTFIVKYNKNLITNKKTGTIHLKNVSSGELPSKKWETKKIDLIATEAYLLAIGVSPLSYHLYDKLTRIYGRKKEYTNIAKLYDDALLNLPKLSLNKRHYKRANKEFTMRMQRTKHRSLLA